jgi:hypothetical protein
MRKIANVLGWAIAPALFLLALAVSARGEQPITVPSEKPSQFIWVTPSGAYTNLPMTRGAERQFTPSRDRWTPVKRTATPHVWAVAAPTGDRITHTYAAGQVACRDVYLGGSSSGGAATVCGDERATVEEQRVRQKGSLVTSTDTVLTVNGLEVMRVRGRRAEHDPSRTVVE